MTADEWTVAPELLWVLRRNGVPIIDHHGQTVRYASPDEALHVAANWGQFRAPTFAELEAMTEEQIIERTIRFNETAEDP